MEGLTIGNLLTVDPNLLFSADCGNCLATGRDLCNIMGTCETDTGAGAGARTGTRTGAGAGARTGAGEGTWTDRCPPRIGDITICLVTTDGVGTDAIDRSPSGTIRRFPQLHIPTLLIEFYSPISSKKTDFIIGRHTYNTNHGSSSNFSYIRHKQKNIRTDNSWPKIYS